MDTIRIDKLGCSLPTLFKIMWVSTFVWLALASCSQNKQANQNNQKITDKPDSTVVKKNTGDSIVSELDSIDIDTLPFQSQLDINMARQERYLALEDSVEKEFGKLLKVLPRYRKKFLKEKAAWEKYKEAVKGVGDCEGHGSSTEMYYIDVLTQATKIRSVPLQYLYLYTKGRKMTYSKTTFTQKMIADAYNDYIRAVE